MAPALEVLALTHQFAKDDCALAKAAREDVDLILGGGGAHAVPGNLGEIVGNWLVVWLPFFIFPEILGIIIPIDFHIFQRGG